MKTCVLGACWALGLMTAAGAEPAVQAQRMLRGASLYALLPPVAQGQGGEAGDAQKAELQAALNEARRCLGERPVRLEIVHADRLTLVQRGRGETFERGDGTAVIVAEPERAAMRVASMPAQPALRQRLPQAIFEAWRVPDCKRE